jgi:hypothetical protein
MEGIPLKLISVRSVDSARGDDESVKKRHFLLVIMLAAGTATFLVAALRRRRDSFDPLPYDRPEGGEREGEFELFIGS